VREAQAVLVLLAVENSNSVASKSGTRIPEEIERLTSRRKGSSATSLHGFTMAFLSGTRPTTFRVHAPPIEQGQM
jgi:hypothetical protein